MHIALACATRRGKQVLEQLIALAPGAELTVFTFPEKPWEPPFTEDIRRTAQKAGADFHLNPRLQAPELASYWTETPPDLLLAVSWRYLIPETIYARPRRGSFVFHDSMLPENRGFAPTVWAIINGQAQTGASLITMADEVDAGLLIDQKPVPIGAQETIARVMDRVTEAYLELIRDNLEALMAGTAQGRPQDETRVTHNPRWTPDDSRIDWDAPAARIYDLIRAVSRPYPGAFTFLKGHKLTIWEAERPLETSRGAPARPGMVIEADSNRILFACGPRGRERLAITLWELKAESTSLKQADCVKIGHICDNDKDR